MFKSEISDQEWDAWRGFRRMGEVISGRIGKEITRTTGLSIPDFSILMQLDQASDSQRRQRDLQAFLEWDKTRLSHQLTRMAGRGLIEREGGDGKNVTIRMTPEGYRQLSAAKPVHAKGMRAYFLDHLSEGELAVLVTIAGKLRSALLD